VFVVTWGDHIRDTQEILDLPYRFGRTTDMTPVIQVLAEAGMPGAEVTSFNQLTLGDGRVALLTTFSPFWPVVAIDEIPPRHDLVLIADIPIPTPVLQLARSIREGILLVDLRRGRVWDEGRLVNGDEPNRGASRYRYAVFATAKVLVRHSGDVDRVMNLAGLTRLQVEDSLDVLQQMLRPFHGGWEAKRSSDLLDWILACYPGAGGVSTYWKSDLPLEMQVERIRAHADVRLSGTWAAHQQMKSIEATSITVFARTRVDLEPLGFRPATWHDATVTVVLPEDRTLFGTSKYLGPVGCTDEFTTAHVTAHDPRLSLAEQDATFAAMRAHLQGQIELDQDLDWNLPD
jgi:hypothetical protein